MTVLWVLKSSDVMKAMYIACGLACFIEHIFASKTVSITIQDMGYAYQIQIDKESEIIIETVRKNGLPLLLPAIFTLSPKEKKSIDKGGDAEQIRRKYIPLEYPNQLVVDYPLLREQLRKRHKNGSITDGISADKTLNYPLYELLCFGFLSGSVMRALYPLLVHTWYAHSKDSENAVNLLNLILKFFGNTIGENRGLVDTWRKTTKALLAYPDFQIFAWQKWHADVTLSSLLATTSSRGQNLYKANQRKQEKPQKVFWIEVFFAFVGFMAVAMPFSSKGKGRKPDLVIFYPCFQKTNWHLLRQTVALCKQYIRESKKFDLSSKFSFQKLSTLTFLDLYRAMLNLEKQVTVSNQVLGLAATTYKFMTANHIPDSSSVFKLSVGTKRFQQGSEKSIARLLKLQNELASIDDRDSEGFIIFRDFLAYFEHEDIAAWIRFNLYFTEYRLKSMTSNFLPPALSEFFEEFKQMASQNQDYRPIIQDPGLKELANAINFCVIRIAYRKHGKKKISSAFKIRYGIGFELLRASNDSEIFLRVVSSFIHEYTNESLSVYLSTQETRPRIPVSAYESIVNLVSLYGSDLVAHVLVGLAFSQHFEIPQSDASSSNEKKEEA